MAKINESVRAKVQGVRAWMKSRVVERDTVVDSLLAAALAGENAVLLGPPGTAKSLLARLFAEAVGGRFFEVLLTRFSTPEELLGPFSLSGLQQDSYRRQLAGRVADCEVAFLDEVFKSNAGTLNALLGVLNERVVHDDGKAKRIPLRFVLGASNELPKGEEGLEALWDRFLVRSVVDYTKDRGARARIVSGALSTAPAPTMTLAEWDTAVADAARVTVSDATAMRLVELGEKLTAKGIRISDRRLVKLAKLARSVAYLDGASEVDAEHFLGLRDAVWDSQEQIAEAWGVLAASVSPEYTSALRKHDAVMSTVQQLVAGGRPEDDVKIITQINQALDELKKIGQSVPKESRARTKIRGLMQQLVTVAQEATKRAAARTQGPDLDLTNF